jgi:hypothetical protein
MNGDRILSNIGKPAHHPDVRQMLLELGLPEEAPPILDGVSSDREAPASGTAVFFRTAGQLRKLPGFADLPAVTPIFTDIQFASKGFGGGPPYPGTLPRDLSWDDTRDGVRARFGPPLRTALAVPADRWQFGDLYLTVYFKKKAQTVVRVAAGLEWQV